MEEPGLYTLYPVYTIQPVVKAVVKPVVQPVVQLVGQPVVSCKQGTRVKALDRSCILLQDCIWFNIFEM